MNRIKILPETIQRIQDHIDEHIFQDVYEEEKDYPFCQGPNTILIDFEYEALRVRNWEYTYSGQRVNMDLFRAIGAAMRRKGEIEISFAL